MPGSEKQYTTEKERVEIICADCGLPLAGPTPRTDVTRYLSESSRCQCKPTVVAGDSEGDASVPRPQSAAVITASFSLDEAAEILSDKFEVLSFLGQGGMGTVFKAREKASGTVFAIKLLNPLLLQQEESRKRFEREAKASMQLHDANVAAVYAYGIGANNTPYLVMDFLEGKTLDQILKEEQLLPHARVVDLAIQICDGLTQAHSKGLVHRDLKPSNVMVNETSSGVTMAKIFDFGIVKVVSGQAIDLTAGDMTGTGDICGSPLYMAPEQIQDNNVDQRSDIHALGCVMYKALTGIHPYEGKNVLDTVAKILTTQATPIQQVVKNQLPESLSEVIHKCLSKNPQDRYGTAAQLRADLERIRDGQKVSIKRPAAQRQDINKNGGMTSEFTSIPSGTGSGANGAIKLLISCIVVAAIGLGGFMVWNNRSSSTAPIAAGPTDPYQDAERLDQLSYSYFVKGDYERAIPLLEFGIRTYKANGSKKIGAGREDNYLAENLSHLGKCYLMMHKYKEAQPHYREALDLFKRWGNYSGGMMTEAVTEYAEVLKNLGREADANEMLKDYSAHNNLTSVP